MPNYRYKAIDDFGKKKTGVVSADDASSLESILNRDGLELLSYKVQTVQTSLFTFLDKVTQKDLISIFVHLHQLEKAGVSIIDSITDLKDTADNAKIRNLMNEIYESIKDGNLFSESLAKRPDIFDPVYIGLLQSGERTGTLVNSFESIIEDLKWSMDMKRKIKKATIGPLSGVFIMCLITGVMTTVVVPKVTGFLVGQGVKLPTATTSLIAFSDFVKANWLYMLLVVPVLLILIKILGRSHSMGIIIDNAKLKIPVIGPIMTKIDSAKFCQFFSMTFKSGLGVIECLDTASSVVKNRAIRDSIVGMKGGVADGKKIAASISSTGYFPGLVARMFKIGEESGNMESALDNIKFFYDREINDSIDKLVSLIQPSITFVMGGMLMWIVIAVFGPVYGMFSQM